MSKIRVIDLLNKIANGEIKDKTKFRINWGDMYRDFYYDDSEENQLQCLKNCSDDYSLYDDIRLNDEVEILEEKKIPEKIKLYTLSNNDSADFTTLQDFNNRDIQRTINKIIDYLKSKGE